MVVVTELPVEYEVLLVVVALGSPYRSCWLQLFVLMVGGWKGDCMAMCCQLKYCLGDEGCWEFGWG